MRCNKGNLRLNDRGASVIFAIMGFMFAAMISVVVVSAAFSAAMKSTKQKYDEQGFLLAQSMVGVVTEALLGDGTEITNPDGTTTKKGLTFSYQYIEHKVYEETGGVGKMVIYDFFPSASGSNNYVKYTAGEGTEKPSFIDKTTYDSTAKGSIEKLIHDMAVKIDQDVTDPIGPVVKTVNTSNTVGNETYDVTTVFTMKKDYSLMVVSTAKVISSGIERSKYVVRLNAGATPKRSIDWKTAVVGDDTITIGSGTNSETVGVSTYSVNWPSDKISTVYVTPTTP